MKGIFLVDSGLFTDILTRLLVGIVIGFTTGMTGMGSAVLVVPSLIYILGLSPVTAIGTGLLYSFLTRAYASLEHLRLLTVRRRTAFYISLGSVPSVILTSFLVIKLARLMGNTFNFTLKIIISAVMLMTWMLMFLKLIRRRKGHSEEYYIPQKDFPLWRKLYGIAAGAGVGVLVGSTSIGGGVLLIPILVGIFQLSPNNTVGTSTIVSVVMSAFGFFAYLLGGEVNFPLALIMFVGSIPGVFLGCRLSVKIPNKTLAFILLAVVTISTIIMFAGIIQ